MNNYITSDQIIEFLKIQQLHVDNNNVKTFCNSITNLEDNTSGSICWIRKNDYDISSIKSNIILVPETFKAISHDKAIIFTKNPQLAITYIINNFFMEKTNYKISQKSTIDSSVKISDNVNIDDNVVIGKNCIIGNNTYIYSNCVLYPNTIIGSNVIIHAGAKIGNEGFGYIQNLDGQYIQFPHIGKVIINDGVEIGANTCIDRGALSDTIIGANTKIDNLCHIAHNVKIGKNCLITAKVEISGSSVIGDNVYIGPNATIIDSITIGDNAVIGMGAIVRHDVKEKSTIVPFESFEKRDYIKKMKVLSIDEK